MRKTKNAPHLQSTKLEERRENNMVNSGHYVLLDRTKSFDQSIILGFQKAFRLNIIILLHYISNHPSLCLLAQQGVNIICEVLVLVFDIF